MQYIIKNTLAFTLLAFSLNAQQVSKDSVDMLNARKDNLELSKKINDRKIELANLENSLSEKTNEAGKAALQAQKSADENKVLADRLRSDPQNKKLASQSASAARKAERDAKSARKAADKLEDLKKDIESRKDKIAGDEAKVAPPAATVTIPAQAAAPEVPQTSSPAPSPARIEPTVEIKNDTLRSFTEKVLESTYRNYPQQPGQPAIIINNIIVPSDYNRPAAPTAGISKVNDQDVQDYQEFQNFKAWKRQQLTQQNSNDNFRADNSRSSMRDAGIGTEENVSRSENRLSFRDRFGEMPKRNSGLWVIPVVGVHASNFKADFKQGQADGRTGWNAGLDFRIHTKRFFVQPGAHYFSSSIRMTSEDSISSAPLTTGPRIHSLKVPILLGLYLTKANKGFFKMNVKAGATGTYILAVDKSNVPQFNRDNIEDYSYGLNAGLGFEFGLITLDVSHEWGMSRLFKDNNVKNNVLRATIGLKL